MCACVRVCAVACTCLSLQFRSVCGVCVWFRHLSAARCIEMRSPPWLQPSNCLVEMYPLFSSHALHRHLPSLPRQAPVVNCLIEMGTILMLLYITWRMRPCIVPWVNSTLVVIYTLGDATLLPSCSSTRSVSIKPLPRPSNRMLHHHASGGYRTESTQQQSSVSVRGIFAIERIMCATV